MKEPKTLVAEFLERAQRVSTKQSELTEEQKEALKERQRDEIEAKASARQKQAEDAIRRQLEIAIGRQDIPQATRLAVKFLITAYSSDVVGIWALRYYKQMTKNNDLTPFDRDTTILLKMRGDIK